MRENRIIYYKIYHSSSSENAYFDFEKVKNKVSIKIFVDKTEKFIHSKSPWKTYLNKSPRTVIQPQSEA